MASTTAELGTIGTQKVSQELFQEVLKTVPVPIVYAELSFLAHGILDPQHDEEGGMQRYIKECSERSIMPFSQVKLEWDSNVGCVVPESSSFNPFLAVYKDYDDKAKEIATDFLLEGGKIHRIGINIGNFRFDFGEFRRGLLEKILGKGYDVGGTDLCFSTYHLTGYNQGDYKKSGLTMNYGRIGRGVELQIGRLHDAEKKRVLVDWFNELTGRHGAEVYRESS